MLDTMNAVVIVDRANFVFDGQILAYFELEIV
jgi:hypothetical protein